MQAVYKHAKNFVGDKKQIFEGIHFDGNGVTVSNEGMLLHVSGVPSDVKTVHYKTWALINGDYPNVSRVIPEENEAAAVIRLTLGNMKAWRSLLKPAALIAGKPYNTVCLFERPSGPAIEAYSVDRGQHYTAVLPFLSCETNDFSFPIALNGKQLDSILAFLIDKGASVTRICLYQKLKPVLFATDTNALCVLCPLRS